MQVVILSWEYPPRVVGQLANSVKNLAMDLVRNQMKTCVITYDNYLTGEQEEAGGLRIVRVTNPVYTHIGVLTWVLTLNQEVERAAANVYYNSDRQVDIIDAQEWHFIPAAVTLKKGLGIPFVYSIESLEDHRSHGANSPFNMAIKSIEWLGTYEAERILVKSQWMRDETVRLYKVPAEKIRTVSSAPSKLTGEILENYKIVLERSK